MRLVILFSLLFASLRTFNVLYRLPISIGIISRQLLSSIRTSRNSSYPILNESCLIWFFDALSLLKNGSSIKILPSSSTIEQFDTSRTDTSEKRCLSERTSRGMYIRSLWCSLSLSRPSGSVLKEHSVWESYRCLAAKYASCLLAPGSIMNSRI